MTSTTTATPKHPAKFSEPIIDLLQALVLAEARRVQGRVIPGDCPVQVLDPFAGVGRVHRLARPNRILTRGVEIEPEWAACHPETICADALEWLIRPGNYERFDIVVTSPTYGNRLADHHNAKDGSHRRSYTHDLGRPLAETNSGKLHWGSAYWAFHELAYQRIRYALKPGGLFLLNVSDFYRQKAVVPAVDWHRAAALDAGFVVAGPDIPVATRRLRGVGAETTSARAAHEVILRLRRPEEDPAPWA